MSKAVRLFIVVMLSLSNSIIYAGSFKCGQNLEDSLCWNSPSPPLYMDSTASYIPSHYGMIGPFDRADKIDDAFFPNVDGLYFRSCMEFCRIDTCKSSRAVLAISCPENKVLLSWAEGKARDFANECIGDSGTAIGHMGLPVSSKDICDNYVDRINRYYKDFVSVCDRSGEPSPNEQRGCLIADVWNKGRFHTFVVYKWYDMLSKSYNNVDIQYVTLDVKTGKEYTLDDFVRESDRSAINSILHTFKDIEFSEDQDFVSDVEGCALLEDGLLFYFAPYSMGYLNAIIPYKVLDENNVTIRIE